MVRESSEMTCRVVDSFSKIEHISESEGLIDCQIRILECSKKTKKHAAIINWAEKPYRFLL